MIRGRPPSGDTGAGHAAVRSSPLPAGGWNDQADGTAWIALYCQNMAATPRSPPLCGATGGRRRTPARCFSRLFDDTRLRRILARMLDEGEFLGPYGIRSVSRWLAEHPYVVKVVGRNTASATAQRNPTPASSGARRGGGITPVRGMISGAGVSHPCGSLPC